MKLNIKLLISENLFPGAKFILDVGLRNENYANIKTTVCLW